MKEKDAVKSEPMEEKTNTSENNSEDRQGVAKRASLAIFMLILVMFAGVSFITYFFELKFGKTAGTAALVVAALIIAGYLYRKEIMEKLKRKK